MNYMTTSEASTLWGISAHRVTALCREGRVKGSELKGGSWRIPVGTPKPEDGRASNGRSSAEPAKQQLPPMPIGVSLFANAVTKYEDIDKTLLLKDLIDSGYHATLFLRPRRFGKPLNIDKIRRFFEKSEEDTSLLFKDKLIWQEGERYTAEQGRYPSSI